MNKKWTDVEKQAVLTNYNNMTDSELCQLLQGLGKGHSLDSVRKFRQRLNLKKSKGRPSKLKEVKLEGWNDKPRGERANVVILDETQQVNEGEKE